MNEIKEGQENGKKEISLNKEKKGKRKNKRYKNYKISKIS
jgi:hypothetical protein